MFRFDRARTPLDTWQHPPFRSSLRSRHGLIHGHLRIWVGIGAFTAAALAGGLVAVPLAQAGGTWNGAVEVSGTATLNTGGDGQINAISCASAGNCSAIGTYGDTANGTQAFVVDEAHGTWGTAQEIPGYGALNAGDNDGEILAISCSSPGNCGAGGSYADSSTYSEAFVVNETNGTWGSAMQIPGFATTGTVGVISTVIAVSCSANGDCSAGGTYADDSGDVQAFVVDESNGTWGSAQEVPGSGALNAGNLGLVDAISCTSPGDCGAGGIYTDVSKDSQSFVVNETGGSWGSAQELPGSGALNVGGAGLVDVISCTSPGNCGVGGGYVDASKIDQSFIANESNGTWGSATEMVGVNASGASAINSLVCSSPGNCTAGGGYNDANNFTQSFVVSEIKGVWSSAIEVPNTSLLNVSGNSVVDSVACSAVGYCSAGGYYTDGSHDQQAFVVDESQGVWGNAIEVPGTGTLNATGVAMTTSMSCSADGGCSSGGFYQDAENNNQAFVDSATPLFSAPNAPSLRVVPRANGSALVTITNSAADGGSPITQYQYSLDGGKWLDSSHRGRTTFTIEHLKAGQTYRLAVRAVNIVGMGPVSAHRSFKIG